MMNRFLALILFLFMSSLMIGCVDQHPSSAANSDNGGTTALEMAKSKVEDTGNHPRIIATSVATAQICSLLDLELVGICESSSDLPEKYEGLPAVGTAMSPDMEIIASLKPDWILSPASLQNDLQPKYEALDAEWAFLNLKSLDGMYQSMEELGVIFNRQEEAAVEIAKYKEFIKSYKNNTAGVNYPKVLILMGLPGSYVIATENSYVGSLVAMAGGENVYEGTSEEFLTVNTEDMKTREPDVILRTAHALPQQVAEMFKEDFETNDIWKHFKAVETGKVYDLSYSLFGMSANFQYEEALGELQSLLYEDQEDK